MDFKAPIDITAVLTAVKKHKDILKAVDKLDPAQSAQLLETTAEDDSPVEA